eukprot:347650-Chlamydomonas_euryale.AAC.2
MDSHQDGQPGVQVSDVDMQGQPSVQDMFAELLANQRRQDVDITTMRAQIAALTAHAQQSPMQPPMQPHVPPPMQGPVYGPHLPPQP